MSNLPKQSAENKALQQLFNGLYYQEVPVSEGAYDIIYGFFYSRTGIKEAADTLTQALLTIGFNNRVNPLDILNEFDKAASASDLKKLMIAFFNSGKLPTSKVGYSKGIKSNRWIARNITG